jgi:hypothetical protein
MCRKAHGAAFATYARVRTTKLRFTAGEESLVCFRSSPKARRFFCPICSSPILWLYDTMQEAAWIAAGSLDDDPRIRPTEHIFVASKAPWHEITDEIEQHAEYPADFES